MIGTDRSTVGDRAQAKIVAIVQARMGSTRLPGKVMADVAGKPAIARLLERLGRARQVQEVWLACSELPENGPLAALAQSMGVKVLRGDEHDVLGRFALVARRSDADAVVRITGDCPLVDPDVVDQVVAAFRAGTADFCSNTLKRSFPDGLDVEVFTRAALDRADREAKEPFLREHVTPYIHGRLADRFPAGGFSIEQVVWPQDYSKLRWTLDEPADLDFIRQVFARLPAQFSWQDILALCVLSPELLLINRSVPHNEGTQRDLHRNAPAYGASNKFFERALRTVPLASQTFSKSHQQWVRGTTPLFLDRGRGGRVWDIDGNVYVDFVLGLMPVVLGHCDPDVDGAILEQLSKGIAFSLPTRLEAELAERLQRLVPCAEMARFGKNGSDATTAAIRLARAATNRSKIALAGYHGWHDWYIGTTPRKLGVPESVQALSAKFSFNDADSLEALLRAEPSSYAAIILEPAGTADPSPGFLARVRELADRYGAILIFDEIITGFRINMGGAQAEFGVVPDLACFGKAMSNGMPIAAVVGQRALMRRMEDIFFSGTNGGEALSLAAACATIDKLEREDAVGRMRAHGSAFVSRVRTILDRRGFGGMIDVTSVDWWPRFDIRMPPVDIWLLTSLMRQEFVANGLLLGASFNFCLAHLDSGLDGSIDAALDRAFASVRSHLDSPDPAACLRGTMVRPTFSVR
jgi:glutamate-1-semialdehyde 2,1-aminomutase